LTRDDRPRAPQRAYLALGSNLGDRLAHLQAAVDGLAAEPGIEVIAVSPVYETAPVGGPPQDEYLNAVVEVDTALDARELLGVARRLEAAAHRVRAERWGPRTLDVDVLIVGDEEVNEPDLVVPHPRMAERDFVLVPLSNLDPERAERVARGVSDGAGVRPAGVQLRLP
jgi:2-amino-4-hydroxy-6-hydroxymethyldihydropteridine diphosphokinase